MKFGKNLAIVVRVEISEESGVVAPRSGREDGEETNKNRGEEFGRSVYSDRDKRIAARCRRRKESEIRLKGSLTRLHLGKDSRSRWVSGNTNRGRLSFRIKERRDTFAVRAVHRV